MCLGLASALDMVGVCVSYGIGMRSKQRQPANAKSSLIWKIAQGMQPLHIATVVVPIGLGT